MRVNVGCGQNPTPGWINLDNSPSLRVARWPLLGKIGAAVGLIGPNQAAFIRFARHNRIQWADASRKLPFPKGSVEVIYSCHVFEHLDRWEARIFLAEALRVLASGGILRLAVPDLRQLVDRYLENGDGDRFVAETLLVSPKPRGLRERVHLLVTGGRHHRWLYDASSLCRFLGECGFADPIVLPAGCSRIQDPGPLDLRERDSESLYVEAVKPAC